MLVLREHPDWPNHDARLLLFRAGFFVESAKLCLSNENVLFWGYSPHKCGPAADLLEENAFTELAAIFMPESH